METSAGSDAGSGPSRLQACERCWKRKQRCDRLLPSCSTCTSLGIECKQRMVKFTFDVLSGAEESSNLTNATLGSYVESLKNAVQESGERQPPRKRARRDSTSSAFSLRVRGADDTPATSEQQVGTGSSDTVVVQSAQPVDDDNDEALRGQHVQTEGAATSSDATDRDGDKDASVRASMNGISFLSRDAMAEPRGNGFANIPHRIGMANLVRAAIALDGSNPACPARPDSTLSALMMPSGGASEHFTLNRKATEGFVTLFLDEVAILYPHFDRTQLEKQYHLVVGDIGEAADPSTSAKSLSSHYDKFTAYMVVCIGTLLSPEWARLESYRTKLQCISLDLFEALLDDCDSLTPIACIILMVIYATLSPHGGSAWQLLGLGMKQAIFLGLHRDPEQHMHTAMWSGSEIETRRRLFWTIYILDRSLNSVMDRPFLIQDDDVTVQLPDLSIASGPRGGSHPLSAHILMQASLLSNIRGNPDQSILYNYNNLQHLRGYHSQVSQPLVADLTPTLMRLEQGEARIWTHIFKQASVDDGGHKTTTSYIFDIKDMNGEIAAACKQFIDSLYNRSDHGHFIGSFVDAYDIFISAVFYIQLEHRQGRGMSSDRYAGDHLSGQEVRSGMINDVVNKSCTLTAGIESRFGAVKAFRRVLRDFLALATGQSHPDDIEPFLLNLPDIVPPRITYMIRDTLDKENAGLTPSRA